MAVQWTCFQTAEYGPQRTDLMHACFAHFDRDGDGILNQDEFHSLCCDLFTVDGVAEATSKADSLAIMKLLARKEDAQMGKSDFEFCWKHWLNQVMASKSALIVVDVQNDFIDGSLALRMCKAGHDGCEVVPVINELLDMNFDLVVYTKDAHPANHISFFDNLGQRKLHPSSKVKREDAKMLDTVIFDNTPLVDQILWPVHCVENTSGADFHPDLKLVDDHLVYCKGRDPDVDSYSVLVDNVGQINDALLADLRRRGIGDVFTCGLAYDFCVGSTARDAAALGFRTMVIEDAARGTDLDKMAATRRDLVQAGCLIGDASEVPAMLAKRTRRRQWGLAAAQMAARARPGLARERRGAPARDVTVNAADVDATRPHCQEITAH